MKRPPNRRLLLSALLLAAAAYGAAPLAHQGEALMPTKPMFQPGK